MPPYGTAQGVPALAPFYPSSQYSVFNAEAVAQNEYSQEVHLQPGPTAGAKGIRVEIDFSANPGNVEIEVMESDSDVLGKSGYNLVPQSGDLTQANLQAGPNGAGTRLATDLIPIAGQFVCLFVKTPPSNGGITVTARITRAA